MIKLYKVGGYTRDLFLGIRSKDVDYSVEADSYEAMIDHIVSEGGKIYEFKPEYLTVRARFNDEDRDFVLCRKDGVYRDGRHPEGTEVGTLYDDLARRDFTMNAIALDEDQNIIDPFDGRADLNRGIIRCVGNATDRMKEDSLRLIRAIRFSITKKMTMDFDIRRMFYSHEWMNRLSMVKEDRIRQELTKMFSFSTIETINAFREYPLLADACFSGSLWLKPTSEAKK